MKRISSYAVLAATTALLTVGLTSTAHAATATSAAFYASGTDEVCCTGINTGTTVLKFLTVAIVDESGMMALNVCKDVAPGASCATSVGAPDGGFCGLIFPGSSKHVRGSIAIMDSAHTVKTALPTN